MSDSIEIIYIVCISLSGSILFIGLIRYYNNMIRENNFKMRLSNIRKKIIHSNKIKPVIRISFEELKDEFENEIRNHEIIREENV